MVDEFLSYRVRGYRMRVIAAALFEAIGMHFKAFAAVRRTSATSANTPPGTVSQIECLGPDGVVLAAVEAQHRRLTAAQLKCKIRALREHNVSEAIFITSNGIEGRDADAIEALIRQEFIAGQNIYVTELQPFCSVAMFLLGERGRRTFLECVCHRLETANPVHRSDWGRLLKNV
ncbi:MAG: hypothetical protein KY475_16950 [Planctomycetes bacterium]|nr:hypothetical protein [Planctomycetota bacterium]